MKFSAKRACALLLCAAQLTSVALAAPVTTGPLSPAKHVVTSATPRDEANKTTSSGSLHITDIHPFDGDAAFETMDNPSLADSAAAIKGQFTGNNAGVGAAKHVDIVDVANGVAKVDLDAAYVSQPVDVAFVLDRSGSMNMWVGTVDSTGYSFHNNAVSNPNISSSNVPCLNPIHYYKIAYTLDADNDYIPDDNATVKTFSHYPIAEDGKIKEWPAMLFNDATDHAKDSANGSWLEEYIEDTYEDGKEIIVLGIEGHYARGEKVSPGVYTEDAGMGDDNYNFFSPAISATGNGYQSADGCFDRSTLARYALMQSIEAILARNPENRVAYTTFSRVAYNGVATTLGSDTYTYKNLTIPFTNNLETLSAIQADRGGGQNTNYDSGLSAAQTLFQTTPDGKRKVLVFLSDGTPTTSGIFQTDGGVDEANALKASGVTIYTVGVNAAIGEQLSRLSSGAGYSQDCLTSDALLSHIAKITEDIVPSTVTLTDTLGTGYELLISDEYPLTLTYYDPTDAAANAATGMVSKQLTSKSQFADYGVTLSDSTISWTLDATSHGSRMSFFIQLGSDERNPNAAGRANYPTNASASYTASVPNASGSGSSPATKPLSADEKLVVRHTNLTATKTNDVDPFGGYVERGQEVTYTVTIKNDSGFTLDDIVITDPIPEGTTYVPGTVTDGCTYDPTTNTVTFKADAIPAGGELTYSFTVTVDEYTYLDEIMSEAEFSSGTILGSNGKPLTAMTNQVINPLTVPEPTEEPTPEPTAEPTAEPTVVPTVDSLPKTGDGSNMALFLALAAVSGAILIAARRRQRTANR